MKRIMHILPRKEGGGGLEKHDARTQGVRGRGPRPRFVAFFHVVLVQFGGFTEFAFPNQTRAKVDSNPPVPDRVWTRPGLKSLAG